MRKEENTEEITDVDVVGKNGEIVGGGGEMIEDRLVLNLSKPYEFEGETYNAINLGGLETMTGADMVYVNRKLSRNGNVDFLQEMTLEYAFEFAARAAGQPVEFFKGLPPRDSIKVKNKVTGFLYGSE